MPRTPCSSPRPPDEPGVRGWRPALRLAWRDALRHRGRSALVLLMIALPVLAVSVAAVVITTQQIDPDEALERRLGTADALVYPDSRPGPVLQDADPQVTYYASEPDEGAAAFDVASLAATWDRPLRSVELRTGYADVRVGRRVVETTTVETDWSDPLTTGLFRLEEGRWPTSIDEVVVNGELARRGVAVGDVLDVESAGSAPTVVGVGEDATYRTLPVAVGPLGSLGAGEVADSVPSWLVDGGAVSWADVRAANATGAYVVSRAVLVDPPSQAELAPEVRATETGIGSDDALAVLVLVVVMALLEVVLLAGPAFAVGARRQARTLALMAACGGTPRQARRVVLASGLVLGAVAAAIGVVLGSGVAVLVIPLVQRFSGTWLGPFDVPWLVLVGVGGFGLLSAFLAAVVPAVSASRQDVVAVLAGRRGDRRPSTASPIVGLVLLGLGVLVSAFGATRSTGGEVLIAASAVVAVLGMILLVPVVVTTLARLSRRLPLSLRYAARDAARHRTRTVPAVAAVAATVAGVVALGIGASSDARQNQETYAPMLAMGDGIVTLSPAYSSSSGTSTPPTDAQWADVGASVRDRVDDVRPIDGVPQQDAEGRWVNLLFGSMREPLLTSYGGVLTTTVLVSDDTVPPPLDLDGADRRRAERALAEGHAVLLTRGPVDSDTGATEVKVRVDRYPENGEPGDEVVMRTRVPAVVVHVDDDPPVQAVLPTVLADELDLEVGPAGLFLPQPALGADQQEDLQEVLSGLSGGASVYVERGYTNDDQTTIVLLVLGALGGILMLGGTLTATFLALSDARPDLATLASVGASPRTRRRVAAAYALVVGGVGAVLGAAVGFVPGLAIVRPLTYQAAGSGLQASSGPFYDVPWLLVLGVVVALPLVTAVLVGLTARSRLPLVARLD